MSVSQIFMFVNSFIFSIFVCKRNPKGYGRRVRRTVLIMRRQDLMTRAQLTNLILLRRVTTITRDLRRDQEATVVIIRRQDLMTRRPAESYTTTENALST